jgi:hypothetical protein
MPLPFALVFASATAMVSVSAHVPPRCGYSLTAQTLDAWCNAERWSVVAQRSDGSEAVLWRASGVGSVTLPASGEASFRLDVDY